MSTTDFVVAGHQELWQNVQTLENRVGALDKRLESPSTGTASEPGLGELVTEVVRITQDLFPGEVSLRVVNDSESPQDSFTVVEAQATGTTEEIEDRRIE